MPLDHCKIKRISCKMDLSPPVIRIQMDTFDSSTTLLEVIIKEESPTLVVNDRFNENVKLEIFL